MLDSAFVYKILLPEEWAELRRSGRFAGSRDDQRDGYIHLSTAMQVEETIARHFPGNHRLMLAALVSEDWGDALKFEVSRGGQPFPHLYTDMSWVACRQHLMGELDSAGHWQWNAVPTTPLK